jgi:CHAT domain-containing protein
MAVGISVVLTAIVFFCLRLSYFQNAYALYRAERFIRSSQSSVRTTLGRTSGAPYAKFSSEGSPANDLGRAELLILNLPHSERRDYLQSLVDLGTREWQLAAGRLQELANQNTTPQIANDLGVAFLQLSQRDAIYIFKALNQFELAEKLDPSAPEPHFNRLLVLHKLQLVRREHEERLEYSKLETTGPWNEEILGEPVIPEEQIAAQLQSAIDRRDDSLAMMIFRRNPNVCRKIAMRYAMNPREANESEKVATVVADLISREYGDETVSYLLLPLKQGDPSAVIEARRLVAEGTNYYLKDDLNRSFEEYRKARAVLQDSKSAIDHVWVDLNEASSELRSGNLDAARTALDRVVAEARADNLKWILANALSTYGAFRALNSNFGEMLAHLDEAARLCDEIGASQASARARFYMMAQRYEGGDLDGALQLAVECLNVTEPTEHVRLASVLSHIGVILFKKGFVGQAVDISDESLEQAVETQNPSLIVGTATSLALIDELIGQTHSSDLAINQSEEAIATISRESERIRTQVSINNTKARIYLNRGRVAEAEDIQRQSILAIERFKDPGITWLKAETWMLQGQTYARSNKLQQARESFHAAIDSAENDSNFVTMERFRLAFDDGRRELYDSAIAFEYEHGATDAAWTYLQHYRAKLFIENLALFNPEIEKIHSIALDRNQVQKAIPPDLQVVEYALLPDRLLIWVVSKERFETRSIPIARDVLEQKVQEFLANLRGEKPVDAQSAELYKILVAPIETILDPQKALAIIPDRALHGLPFAAIQCPEDMYLIQKYPIIESPTLTHLLAVNTAKTRRNEIVTFGSRTEDAAENREINAMQDIYRKVSAFAGPQVTKATFLDEMERAFVLHYAGHSVHDAADPLRSSILLDGDQGGPNSITAVDIVGHKLQPNALVVLSSCDSSVGNSKDGVGIRGLTSAFLISGAGAVVGSLWPVESTSASTLMIDFHKGFAQDQLPVADALRKAQLDFISANPRRTHPYYWSGFVVTANFSALR